MGIRFWRSVATFCFALQFISAGESRADQFWWVTHAVSLSTPDGNPLLYAGQPVEIFEFDFGPTVANIKEYYWIGAVRNADQTCTYVPGLFGIKVPKPSTITELCSGGQAFRANFYAGYTDTLLTARFECVNKSLGIYFKVPGSGDPGTILLSGANGGVTPFQGLTVKSACPAGFVDATID